jgi:hypothetical protein
MRLRGLVRSMVVGLVLAASAPAYAQNAAPKNESDCGVTTMCTTPVPAPPGQVPVWAVELLMFGVLVLLAFVGYRLMLARHRPAP